MFSRANILTSKFLSCRRWRAARPGVICGFVWTMWFAERKTLSLVCSTNSAANEALSVMRFKGPLSTLNTKFIEFSVAYADSCLAYCGTPRNRPSHRNGPAKWKSRSSSTRESSQRSFVPRWLFRLLVCLFAVLNYLQFVACNFVSELTKKALLREACELLEKTIANLLT